MNLKQALIDLGYQKPELKEHLRPVLAKMDKVANYTLIQAVKHWNGKGLMVATAVGGRMSAPLKELDGMKDKHQLKKLIGDMGKIKTDKDTMVMCFEGSLYVVQVHTIECDAEDCERLLKVIQYDSNKAGFHYRDDLYL